MNLSDDDRGKRRRVREKMSWGEGEDNGLEDKGGWLAGKDSTQSSHTQRERERNKRRRRKQRERER